MKNKRILIICLTIAHITLLPSLTPGQAPAHDLGLAPDFVAEKVADIVITPHGSKWLVLRQDARIPPLAIFDENRAAFYLGKDDRMDIQRIEEDGLGFTHYPYQQLYKGLPVEGAEMLVHARDGYAARANGNIVTGLSLSVQPAISEAVALESALNAFGAETYM